MRAAVLVVVISTTSAKAMALVMVETMEVDGWVVMTEVMMARAAPVKKKVVPKVRDAERLPRSDQA